jgi:L-alanine-DL-glutamate epimerase-like enolase superfamily enzyme
MRLSARLFRAELHYAGGRTLRTGTSGVIPHLAELYLALETRDAYGLGEVRTNVSYLNRLEPDAVIAEAIEAVSTGDWMAKSPAALDMMPRWAARRSAPVRMLVDMALHDLAARRANVPLTAWLGGTSPARYATNQTLFWSSLDDLLMNAQAYVERGFHHLKLRTAITPLAQDCRRLEALRDRFGSRITLAIDSNGQWAPSEALEYLRALARFGLAYAEQPVAAGDWEAARILAAESPVPIMLDESIASLEDVDRAIALGGRAWCHLKLIKFGGIAQVLEAARRLSNAGVPFMIGQMNEGAAATAAALHVAATVSPAFAELYGADQLIDDPTSGIVYGRGNVSTTGASGLGVTFEPAKAVELTRIDV